MNVKHIKTDLLNIAYLEYGQPDGKPLILMHGFPYDVHAYDEVCRILTEKKEENWHIYVPWLRGFGSTTFLSEETMRSGEQSALAWDLIRFIEALGLERTYLAGFDWGGRAACIVSALYPEKVLGLVSCGVGYNMQNPGTWQRPVSPEVEIRSWYMYYFNTRRGKNALQERRSEVSRFLWKLWSPDWQFTEGDFLKSAVSFENPDFPEVVAHSYRCRIGEEPEDPRYQEISSACAKQPAISVPSVILLGMSDTVTVPPETDTDALHFTGYYKRKLLAGIGHNVPQEAPFALADALEELLKQAV